MKSIDAYVIGKCSMHCLKKFCKDAFLREFPVDLKDRIKVQYLMLPIVNNGYVQVNRHKGKYKYRLCINLFPFLMGHFTSNRMRLFYLYATVVHELKHVELLEGERVNEYSELLAFWEEYRNFSKLRVLDYMGLILMRKTSRVSCKRCYQVSVAEILCNLSGFQRSYEVLSPHLAESEADTIKKMIASLSFLKEHIVITYSNRNHPYHLFTKMIREVQEVIKRDPCKRDKDLKPMECLFLHEGQVKSMEQLFLDRDNANAPLIDSLLINCFICADMYFSAMFRKCPGLRNHLEELANRYCRSTIEYLKDSEIGKVFLDESILKDNATMLAKNVERLNKLMAQYDMTHTEGSIIPLYYTGK